VPAERALYVVAAPSSLNLLTCIMRVQILCLFKVQCHEFVECIAFSADGKRIMMGTEYGVVVIADAATGAKVSSFVGVR